MSGGKALRVADVENTWTALIVLMILIAVLSAWLLYNKKGAQGSESMETRGNR